MKVKILSAVLVPPTEYKPGKVYNLPPRLALSFIASGWAEALDAPVPRRIKNESLDDPTGRHGLAEKAQSKG